MNSKKIFFPLLVLLSVVIAQSCAGNKNNTETVEEINETVNNPDELLKLGFQKAIVKFMEDENDCPYTIQLLDSKNVQLMDPINLEESYMEDELIVWIKFRLLRMQNRCDIAQPISIDEIR